MSEKANKDDERKRNDDLKRRIQVKETEELMKLIGKSNSKAKMRIIQQKIKRFASQDYREELKSEQWLKILLKLLQGATMEKTDKKLMDLSSYIVRKDLVKGDSRVPKKCLNIMLNRKTTNANKSSELLKKYNTFTKLLERKFTPSACKKASSIAAELLQKGLNTKNPYYTACLHKNFFEHIKFKDVKLDKVRLIKSVQSHIQKYPNSRKYFRQILQGPFWENFYDKSYFIPRTSNEKLIETTFELFVFLDAGDLRSSAFFTTQVYYSILHFLLAQHCTNYSALAHLAKFLPFVAKMAEREKSGMGKIRERCRYIINNVERIRPELLAKIISKEPRSISLEVPKNSTNITKSTNQRRKMSEVKQRDTEVSDIRSFDEEESFKVSRHLRSSHEVQKNPTNITKPTNQRLKMSEVKQRDTEVPDIRGINEEETFKVSRHVRSSHEVQENPTNIVGLNLKQNEIPHREREVEIGNRRIDMEEVDEEENSTEDDDDTINTKKDPIILDCNCEHCTMRTLYNNDNSSHPGIHKKIPSMVKLLRNNDFKPQHALKLLEDIACRHPEELSSIDDLDGLVGDDNADTTYIITRIAQTNPEALQDRDEVDLYLDQIEDSETKADMANVVIYQIYPVIARFGKQEAEHIFFLESNEFNVRDDYSSLVPVILYHWQELAHLYPELMKEQKENGYLDMSSFLKDPSTEVQAQRLLDIVDETNLFFHFSENKKVPLWIDRVSEMLSSKRKNDWQAVAKRIGFSSYEIEQWSGQSLTDPPRNMLMTFYSNK